MINLGYGSLIRICRIVAVLEPRTSPGVINHSEPLRRLRDKAEKQNLLVDCTYGRKTHSYVIADSGHVFLSAVSPEILAARVDKCPA